MIRTFSTPQEKAEFYINKYTDIVLNATKKDIGKVKRATGNQESTESLRLSAAGALWLTVCEHPEKSLSETIKIAKKLFSKEIRNEYDDEILRNRTRKGSPESYTTTSWGTNMQANGQYIDPKESPDKLVERELELKYLIKIADQLILKWGPHAATWALASFKNDGILATARSLGFTDKEIYNQKVITWEFRKLYKILSDIRLEMEQLE